MVLLKAAVSGAQPVTRIAAGGFHSLFLKSDGSLWGMGYNAYGQLGDGTYNNTNLPELIVGSNVTAVAAGGQDGEPPFPHNGNHHSLFLKSDGSLWVMGANQYGELGDGTFNQTNRPEQILGSNVTAIAAGTFHSLVLKSGGSLWAMGWNNYGQLGDGASEIDTNVPELIVASNVTAIAGGNVHSLFLKSDGSLWAMGFNYYGELGSGSYSHISPFSTNLPELIVASNVTAIAAGGNFSLFLKSDGSLWGMGYNAYGQLGDGTYDNTNLPEQIVASNVTAIVAGYEHSLFLKSDGSLWGMGNNVSGQLGDGTYNNTNVPEQIVARGVTAIAAGEYHSLFLKSDGSLWAMGSGNFGQLGDGTNNINYSTNRPEQILAPYNQISGRLLGGTNMHFSFVGVAGANYALDRSAGLSPPIWIPQVTNAASSFGSMTFTNTPDATTNNFWRIRLIQ